ncbi:hypothetical protein Q3G72_026359 [Acer saccharum]|nr:hypothetical protein Q3G72_026359 [Acer saccharum]
MPYSIKRDAVRARLARLLMEILIFADLLGPITLGYQLGSYASGAAGNVENLSVDIVSDGETTNYHLLGPQTEMQTTSSPNKKKLHAGRDSADVTIPEVEKFEEVEMDSSRVKKGAINAAPRNEDAI